MDEPAFRTLLYRYFFFDWLFKDVETGNVFERAAAVRHNREQARWLPVYVLRWLWWGLAFYALGSVAELILEATTAVHAVLCDQWSQRSVQRRHRGGMDRAQGRARTRLKLG